MSKAFYDGSDELEVLTLNQKAFSSKQNRRILSVCYGEMTEIFQELNIVIVVMNDPEDVKAYQKSIERLRVHIFLAGLDEDFDQIRREILRRDTVPNLDECYSLIRREAVRNTSLKEDSGAVEPSALVAQNRYTQSRQNRPNNGKTTKGIDKFSYKCNQCKKMCHTKSHRFELVGYPVVQRKINMDLPQQQLLKQRP